MPLLPCRRPAPFFRLATIAIALAAIATVSSSAVAQALPPRAADGLLTRPDLQALEEARRLRDARPLVAALRHADAAMRARAAFALASVQDPSGRDALLEALDDPDARVRADAAFALGLLGDSSAVPALRARLPVETDPAAQLLAFDAYGRVGTADDLRGLTRRTHVYSRAGIAHALARAAARGVVVSEAASWLIGQLSAEDPSLSAAAAYALGRPSDTAWWAPHADELRDALAQLDPSDPIAMHVALALGRLRDGRDAQALAALLASPDWRVRANAARALGGQRPEALIAALDDESVLVGVAAATSLQQAELTPAQVQQLSRRAARLPDRWEVWAALVPALPTLAAADLLAQSETLGALPEAYGRAALIGALVEVAPPDLAFETVRRAVDEDPRVAYAALAALAERWAEERETTPDAARYYRAFRAGLERGDMATVFAAAPPMADSLFQGFGALDALQQTYGALALPADIEPMIEVLRALGAAGRPEAAALLRREATGGGHAQVRLAAAEALERLTGEAVELAAEAPAFPALDWAYLRSLGPSPRLVLETERGTVALELAPEQAPLTVQALTRLARDGAYDSVPFHRVVPNFVVQGGDFARRDGFGGPDFTLPTESTRLGYATGTLGVASAGRDTEGAQFFVTHSPQPHLDGRYTAFGRVTEGQDVVDALRIGDRVLRARVE